jgi:hypothetical protein
MAIILLDRQLETVGNSDVLPSRSSPQTDIIYGLVKHGRISGVEKKSGRDETTQLLVLLRTHASKHNTQLLALSGVSEQRDTEKEGSGMI